MGRNSPYPPSACTAVNACRWPICRPFRLEPSGPYERKSGVPTEAEPSMSRLGSTLPRAASSILKCLWDDDDVLKNPCLNSYL
eukprot:5921468-Pleurochrysis_carterae.AAC.1